MIGAHMTTAGGLQNALLGGKEIGCETVQVFTRNPSQWQSKPLSAETRAAFAAAVDATGISEVFAHDAYLINLAAADLTVLAKSQAAFADELERAEALALKAVVTHLGAHLGRGEDNGLSQLSRSLRHALAATAGYQVCIALETTAGQGTTLGYRFEQIARVLDDCDGDGRLCVCLDTCHVFAAGYDLRDESSYRATWQEFDARIGRSRLRLIHANDSQKAFGSRVDRHAGIGDGELGTSAFRLLMNDPTLAAVPKIIETPELKTMHAENLRRLRALIGS